MDLVWLGSQMTAQFWAALGEIVLINLILSGDNAVVIALACRGLPPSQRKMGIMLGALVAILMRVVVTVVATQVLAVPWLMTIASLVLFWIAIKLLVGDGEETNVQQSSNVWGAVRTIAIADLVMSLDNVVAVAAAAKGNGMSIVIGLMISMPLIIFGATVVMWLLTKAPALVWAGAALLGWIAGELIVSDPAILRILESWNAAWVFTPDPKEATKAVLSIIKYGAATVGAAFVIVVGWLLRKRHVMAEAAH